MDGGSESDADSDILEHEVSDAGRKAAAPTPPVKVVPPPEEEDDEYDESKVFTASDNSIKKQTAAFKNLLGEASKHRRGPKEDGYTPTRVENAPNSPLTRSRGNRLKDAREIQTEEGDSPRMPRVMDVNATKMPGVPEPGGQGDRRGLVGLSLPELPGKQQTKPKASISTRKKSMDLSIGETVEVNDRLRLTKISVDQNRLGSPRASPRGSPATPRASKGGPSIGTPRGGGGRVNSRQVASLLTGGAGGAIDVDNLNLLQAPRASQKLKPLAGRVPNDQDVFSQDQSDL